MNHSVFLSLLLLHHIVDYCSSICQTTTHGQVMGSLGVIFLVLFLIDCSGILIKSMLAIKSVARTDFGIEWALRLLSLICVHATQCLA